MPLYEYRCKECGHQFEKIQSFSAPEEKECPKCQGQLERLISAPAIQFKGSGWYVSDYARKSGSKAPTGEAKAEGSSSEKPAASPNGSDSAASSSSAAQTATPKPAPSTSKDK